ncbi:MAG: EamA family transporter [Erysipelotrichaceae bacterium]|nr:EamA family transporter [Erysipelotrichaceae bacterium]
MINIYAFLMVFNAFLTAVSQLLLKKSANQTHNNKLQEFLNIRVILGYGILFSTFLLNIVAYRGIEYKYGPILNSTSYAFVLLLGGLILKEKITLKKITGMMLIISGIIIFSL